MKLLKKGLENVSFQKRILILLMVLLIVGCSSIAPEKACNADTDCVPAACCHAQEAVHKNFAPDCSGVLCTAFCEPGTLDCGQGTVKCIAKTCQVELND